MSENVLEYFGLKPVTDEATLFIIYGDTPPAGAKESLQKWLTLLPENITAVISAALRQERPFLPPEVTPEMMAAKNSKVSTMNQMEVLYRCVDLAFQAKEFKMAACISFVVDRASYWSGTSKAVLQVVELIKQANPDVPIAPQIQVRKARVLKDDGDLHGAMKVLDQILDGPQGLPGEWQYANDDQYINTKAEIIKIKGNILHNLGLMKEAVDPLLESIRLFASLQEKDDKGIASSLALLTKCLGKLSLEEYDEVRRKYPDDFTADHPCHESYIQGKKAVGFIQSLQESLYRSKDLLDADTSLLKYAVLRPSISEEYKLFQTIMAEMKTSLNAHKTVDTLRSSEQFFEFVRALFMIHLTLAFSPVLQDQSVSQVLQQLSIELYLHFCNHNKDQQAARLEHTQKSVQFMNLALTILSLPVLLGMVEPVGQKKEEEARTSVNSEDSDDSELENKANGECAEIEQNILLGSKEQETNLAVADLRNQQGCPDAQFANSNISTNSLSGNNVQMVKSSSGDCETSNYGQIENECPVKTDFPSQDKFLTEPSKSSPKVPEVQRDKYGTLDNRLPEERQKNVMKKDGQGRGWTYSFGFGPGGTDDIGQRKQYCHTFPQMTKGKLLDPTKQWQTYKHQCVGLPVDPNFFSSLVPSDENLYEIDTDASSMEEKDELLPLVNLSVPFIQRTVENKASNEEKTPKEGSFVDLEATTVSSSFCSEHSKEFPLHPHDLPNQPMRSQADRDKQLLNDNIDGSEFAPLVDLTGTTVTDSLEELRLGKSISASGDIISAADPVRYISNWRPLDHPDTQGFKIRRAFLLNYNPATSYWTAQSTLTFVGEPLDLAKGKKGHCRDAFHVQFLHQDEPRGRYVGKRFSKRYAHHHHPTRYMQDVICQMMAGYYVIKFNEAMQNYKRDIQVQFLPVGHLQLLTRDGDLEDCFNVEPYLHGDFIKLTNNLSFSNKKEHQGEELATALTHFSYCESKGTLMIVDIQGWLPREGSGVIYLTDPQFHTSGMERFSTFDHQEKGMTKFWESVHPDCNDMCRAIGLERPSK